LALTAAAAFSFAIPFEHRAADQAPDAAGLSLRQIGRFIRATARSRWWLAAMGLNALGFGLHALALHNGGLAIVQPLLVANLLFALPINHWLRKEPITAAEVGWAAALVVALSGFLLIATAGVGATVQMADRGPAVATGVLVVLVVGGLTVTARHSGGSTAATLFGVSTGILFAVTASLVKECTGIIVHGPIALLTSWQLYALLVAGGAGILLNQLAFQSGPLSASLPAITVVDPVVSVLFGVLVFDENLRHTPLAITGEVLTLGLLAAAAFNLSRLERAPEPIPAGHSSGQPTSSPR
jgi:hypothetical protein